MEEASRYLKYSNACAFSIASTHFIIFSSYLNNIQWLGSKVFWTLVAVVCRKYSMEPSSFGRHADHAPVNVLVSLKKRKAAAGATPTSILC